MKKTLRILMLFALLFGTAKMNAQVTIGDDIAPKPFSVLELYAQYSSGTYGGLRLPQMTTEQRNGLFTGKPAEAKGLLIYNLDNNCIEYWNDVKWVSLCLGTAHITLLSDCDYTDPIPADGVPATECVYTPVDEPACVVTSGEAYSVLLVLGSAYANLTIVNEVTSAFTVKFTENNSSTVRIAIVRVTNNCSGEFSEFVFTQEGSTCPTGIGAFTLDHTSTELCGNNGAVIAWIIGAEEGVDYIWEYGGTIIHTGTYMQITKAGTYTVYAGLLGCTETTPQPLVITRNDGIYSAAAPTINVTNGGILCSGGKVYLTANTYPVKWFHNGVFHSSTAIPLELSLASDAGEWFATQQDGTCGSRMSNIVIVTDNAGTTALDTPQPTVNGTPFSMNPIVCKGGTIELSLTNAAAYLSFPGTVFEWFINGTSVHIGTNPTIYTVAPSTSLITISVQVSSTLSGCPSTEMSDPIEVNLIAPPATSINSGSSQAVICGTTPALLMAANASGDSYEWFRDGIKVSTTATPIYYAPTPGVYAVRYADGDCFSPLSMGITVVLSAGINMQWQTAPSTSNTEGTAESISVNTSVTPEDYIWTSSNTSVATVTKIPPGNTAVVNYLTPGTFDLTVKASNACGDVTLTKNITVTSGCHAVTSVTIVPVGTVTKALDATGTPKTSGDANTVFSINAIGGTTSTIAYPITYAWYLDGGGTAVQTGSSTTYTYTTPSTSGTHTVYAKAYNTCTPASYPQSPTTTVNVTRDFAPDPSGNYILSGKICYDVKRLNNGTNDCMPLTSRIDDFASTKQFTYTLSSPSNSAFTVVGFEVQDASNVLSTTNPITWSGAVATVTFRSDINTYAQGVTKNAALELTIIAKYRDNNNVEKQVSLLVKVQDCGCGCTVKTVGGGWLTFMCWNLGAAEVIKTKTPNEQAAHTAPADNYGDLYQWGRQTDGHEKRTSANVGGPASGANLNSNGQPIGNYAGKFITGGNDWRSPALSTLWNSGTETVPVKTVNDPCPVGWRLPTATEFRNIVNGTTIAQSYSGTATSGNKFTWNATGTTGVKVSPDNGVTTTLFLPAGGWRNVGGQLTAGNGYYWSSSLPTVNGGRFNLFPTSINVDTYDYKTFAFSIRCVVQ